jgi:hypothetical protein
LEASAAAREFNSFDLASGAIDRIWEADSEEDIWAANDASGLESFKTSPYLLGRPLRIVEYHPVKGDSAFEENGLGYFAAFQANEDDGTIHNIGCGAPQIVGLMEKLNQKGKLIGTRVVFRAKGTMKGFERLTVERA